MKTAVLATAMAAAILCAASAANAAHTVILTPPATDGSLTGMFGETAIAAGDFSDTFTFTMPAGIAGATITTNWVGSLLSNIDFSSVTFNGNPFSLGPTGQVENGFVLNLPVTSGTQTLVVNGKSGGNGSFSGTLSFALAALPEPASWALMIVGFGGIGAMLRRRPSAGPDVFGVGQSV
jgi:opacity protein-like surface antigen